MRVGISAEFMGVKHGGTATYTRNLLAGLAMIRTPHHFYAYLSSRTALPLVPRVATITPRLVPPYGAWLRLPVTLPAELLRRPVDLLHAQGWGPPYAPCPMLLTVHDIAFETHADLYPPALRWRLRRLVRSSVRRAALVTASSTATAQELMHIYGTPAAAIRVIPCPLSTDWAPVHDPVVCARVQTRYGIQAPYILYVGSIEPKKGVDKLIRAFATLYGQQSVRHQLVIAGKPLWLSDPILTLPDELGIAQAVRWTGPVAHEDLAALYSGADLFAFLGYHEGFGYPPVEAMACGAPVLAAARTSLSEVLGDAALLVDPFDEADVVRGLRRLLDDRDLRNQLRERGQQRVTLFHPAPIARQMIAVYEECLALTRGRNGHPAPVAADRQRGQSEES